MDPTFFQSNWTRRVSSPAGGGRGRSRHSTATTSRRRRRRRRRKRKDGVLVHSGLLAD